MALNVELLTVGFRDLQASGRIEHREFFKFLFVRQFGKDAAVAHRDPQLIASMEYDNA